MNSEDALPSEDMTWLSGGGQMGALIRSIDWSKTSLGKPETWPQSLRTSVNLCLSSTFPILICWGPDDIQIYNDSYRPICGDLHPKSMGMPFKICWEAALPVVGDKFDRARLGEGTYINNQRMFLERYGYLEEAWMTFSFSPIQNETGHVGGIFHPITETTNAMLSARRTQTLRDFAARLSTAKSVEEVVNLAGSDRDKFELDLPFFAFYKIESDGSTAKLVGSSGIVDGSKLAPASLSFGRASEDVWKISEVLGSDSVLEIPDLSKRFGPFESGPYPEAPTSAVVLSVRPPSHPGTFGFLIAGVSSRRALDHEYKNFFALLANTFTTAISNVLAYEEELKRAEALAEIDRAKTAFFSNVSHEFRTPLTLILGPLEDSLKDLDDPLSDKQRSRQEVTHRNALRLLKLVNSLLDFSRIEAGRVQASYRPTNLSRVTADIASAFRSATDRAGIELNIDCEELPEPIFVDQEMWEKIVLNLVSNAFKFTFAGSIDVRIRWAGQGARLEIADTGTGVPEEEIPRLFERFHRVENARGRSFEGTGIGLALVQELVRLHGGSISVTSTLDKGTTFTIEIPKGSSHLPQDRLGADQDVQPTSNSANAFFEEASRWLPDHSAEPSEAMPQAASEEKPLIIVADDNADMLSYIKDLLSGDYEVIPAVDGLDALSKAQKQMPDLILSDVMMPKLDGFALLKEIRSNPNSKRIPVILLSARAGEEARLEGLNAGADEYLVKPFSARELKTRVAATLKMDRMRAEQTKSLKESEERFRKMFASAAVSIVLMDLSGNILQINNAFANSLGYRPEEIIGKHFSAFTHPDDVTPNLLEVEKLGSGQKSAATFEKRYLKRNGEILSVQTSVSAYYSDDGKPLQLVAISQDISSRIASEEKARLAKKEAERANESKSAFLANMSHEIRTPMNAVLGFTEVLRDPDITENERAHAIERIDRSGRSLLALIDDILDLSKVESGKVEIVEAYFSPLELATEVVSLLRLSAEQKGVELRLEASSSMPDLAHSDASRVRQILINLLGNAVKFTDNGYVSISIRAEFDRYVIFEIRDTGAGISASDQTRLFRPFAQADASITRKYGGTGLGLVLSKRLTESLGGDLKLEWSELGKGSRFVATIDGGPFRSKSGEMPTGVERTKPAFISLEGIKVLVAEDVPDNQFLMRRYLESADAEVDMASDGKEAVMMAQSKSYDIVLMDVQMPVMDGLTATQTLRSKGYTKPILALTAHAMPEEIARSIRAGCIAHLTKPIAKSDLIEAVKLHAPKAN